MVEDLADAPALFSPALIPSFGPALLEPDALARSELPFQGAVCNHPVAALWCGIGLTGDRARAARSRKAYCLDARSGTLRSCSRSSGDSSIPAFSRTFRVCSKVSSRPSSLPSTRPFSMPTAMPWL